MTITPSMPASRALVLISSAIRSGRPARTIRPLMGSGSWSAVRLSSSSAATVPLVSSVGGSRPTSAQRLGHHLELGWYLVEVREHVEVVTVACGQSEGLLLSATAD